MGILGGPGTSFLRRYCEVEDGESSESRGTGEGGEGEAGGNRTATQAGRTVWTGGKSRTGPGRSPDVQDGAL